MTEAIRSDRYDELTAFVVQADVLVLAETSLQATEIAVRGLEAVGIQAIVGTAQPQPTGVRLTMARRAKVSAVMAPRARFVPERSSG